MTRQWEPVIEAAAAIVREYPYLITLRQLHYRLVSTLGLGYENNQTCYKRLSDLTAQGRREGRFPRLLDQTRSVHQLTSWTSPKQALEAIAAQFHLDRTADQEHVLLLGGEKATLLAQLDRWFAPLGVPIVLLRGYGSQTYVDEVAWHVRRDGRKAVLIYAGDFDPSGEDILRDLVERCDVWDEVVHVAVTAEHIDELSLVVNPGKMTDSRAAPLHRPPR